MADWWTKNEHFKTHIEGIKAKHPGIQILSARSWCMPLYKVTMHFTVEESRALNPIEHFVLELFMEKDWSREALEELLELPSFLVEEVLGQLKRYDLIEEQSLYVITEKGRLCYERDHTVLITTQMQTYYTMPGMGQPYCGELPEEDKQTEEEEVCPYEEILVKCMEQVDYGSWLEGLEPVNFEVKKEVAEQSVPILEIWIYDEIEEKYYCKIWEPATGVYIKGLGEILTETGEPIIEQVEMDEEYTYMQEQYQQHQLQPLVRSTWIDKYKEDQSLPIEVIRGKAIKPVFMEAIAQTCKQLIIFSPWMSEKVIDSEMIKLFENIVMRGGKIFLGWGISRKREEEDRIPEKRLLKKLASIVDASGESGITVCWIGNNHSKEVVVDDALHMSGSFNFLSYRGDYLPRGESVTIIRQGESVQEAKIYWETVFKEALEREQVTRGE